MILYVNGDSHTAAAEATNPYAFANDDKAYFYMGRAPHPDNLKASWGRLLANHLQTSFYCGAESASSNARIIRTSRNWLDETYPKFNDELLMIIQWSSWEREEWLIDGEYYQINQSGVDCVPEDYQEEYKAFVANVDWDKKYKDAHESIWDFHCELADKGIKHIFFNGNRHFFSKSIDRKKSWGNNYVHPYDPTQTFDAVLQAAGYKTVSPDSWHYGRTAHSHWSRHLLNYILENDIV